MATGIRAQRATHVISRKVKRADYVAEAACIASDECPITRVRRQRMQLGDHPAIDIARRSHAAGTSGTRLLARRLLRLVRGTLAGRSAAYGTRTMRQTVAQTGLLGSDLTVSRPPPLRMCSRGAPVPGSPCCRPSMPCPHFRTATGRASGPLLGPVSRHCWPVLPARTSLADDLPYPTSTSCLVQETELLERGQTFFERKPSQFTAHG